MSIKPLEGVRVLDLTLLPPGGYCTVLLADLGAEVVRVESPSQKGKPSTIFGIMGISRGKRSVTLDMRNPKANDIMKRLVAAADVVVENNKPGVMDQRGFGYSHAAAVNPKIVWCSMTGFGQDGPYADQAGHDLSYMAHSGLLAALNSDLPWHPGATLPVPVGALMAVIGVQAALAQREKTGAGCQIDISLTEAATWLLAGAIGGFTATPMGIPASADRRLYLCADGRWISTAAAEPRTWAALVEGVEAPDLADKLYKRDENAATEARLAGIFKTRSAAEWVAKLGPMGAAVTIVNHGVQIAEDPHVKARGTVFKLGDDYVTSNPVRLSTLAGDKSVTADGAPHMVGEDNDDILASSGFSAAEIEALKAEGVI